MQGFQTELVTHLQKDDGDQQTNVPPVSLWAGDTQRLETMLLGVPGYAAAAQALKELEGHGTASVTDRIKQFRQKRVH